MPIDKKFTDPMLGTLRNMVQKCRDSNISGEAFDNMVKALDRMESLAEEMDDFPEYFEKVTEEDLINKFSNNYGEAVSVSV